MREVIGNRQIVFLLFAGVVGLSLNIPKDFGMYAGTGGWTAPVVEALITMLFGILILKINKKFEQKAIYEYCQYLIGKPLSYIVMALYFFRFILLASIVTCSLLQVVKSTILEKTPFWPLALCFLLCTYYAASRGLKSLSYICEFYISMVILLGALVLFAMFREGDFINLRPFFVAQDIPIYIKESIRNMKAFLGWDILLFIPLNRIQNKKVDRALVVSIILVAVFYIISFEATVAVSGINDTVLYDDIFLLSVRRVEIKNLEMISRLDSIAISNFIFAVLMMTALDIYCSGVILSHFFKKAKSKVLNFNISCIIVSFIVLIICIFIPSTFTLRKYQTFSYRLLILTSIVIPTILYLIAKVKCHEKKT